MPKKIVFTTESGNLCVVHPAPWARLVRVAGDGAAAPFDVLARAYKVTDIGALPAGLKAEWAETEDEFIERVAQKSVPKGTTYQVVEESSIPTDRTFRAAWRAAEGSVVHDVPACREIQRDRIRERRAPLLAQLDAQFNIELEKLLDKLALSDADKAAAKAIAAKRQALRDAPADPAIEAAQTPASLKAVIPSAITKTA